MTNRKRTTYDEFHTAKQKRCLEIVMQVAPQKLPSDSKKTAKDIAALIGITVSNVYKLSCGEYVGKTAMQTILAWGEKQ